MENSYETYEQTSSRFIPFIPAHWRKLKVKHLVDQDKYYPVGDGDHGSIKPSMYQEAGIPYIRVQNLSWDGTIDISNAVYISEDVQRANKKSNLFPGDILIAKTGATIGKLGLIPEEIKEANTTSSVGKVTVDLKYFNPKYILYCFQSKNFNDQIWLEASQKSAQPGFNIDDLIEFEIASPEIQEQNQIAEYLDYQTGLIDQLVTKKEILIQKLQEQRQVIINEAVTKGLNPEVQLKDSGIEWLGEINKSWTTKKVKHCCYVKGRIGWKGLKSDEYLDEGYAYLVTGTDFTGQVVDWSKCHFIDEERYEEDPYIQLEEGDLLLTKDGTIGKTTLVKDLDRPACLNSGIFLVRSLIDDLNINFLYWVLNSKIFQEFIELTSSGATIKHLYQNVFVEFPFALPQLSEQIEIEKYLFQKHEEIENAINKIKSSIQKLKEYRQALISEAVTGKIDVRYWKNPNS